MTPTLASDLRGNWATLLLPVNHDDSIDYGLLAAELDHFVAARVDGVYSNGSAGEFYTQTEDEFDCVSALLAERSNIDVVCDFRYYQLVQMVLTLSY